MRAFNYSLQSLFLVVLVGGIIISICGVIPHYLMSKGFPSSLRERYETSMLADSVDEAKRYEINESETMLLLSAAGVIVALLFTNFVFGKYTFVDKAAYTAAMLAFVAALLSTWFGFRVINELKWLVMFEISSAYWHESRLMVFHLFQTATLLYVATPLMGIFVLRVVNSKLPETTSGS